MKKIRLFFLLALAVSMISIFAACGETEETKQAFTTAETTTTAAPTEESTEDPYALEDGYMYSYLTGLPVKTEVGTKRPLAFQIDNERLALPQSGISTAEVIYEVPIEADEVRLTAIIQDISGLDRVGPLRSARSYHPGIVAEFDAIFIHNGHSKYAQSILKSENCDDIELVDVDYSYKFTRSDHSSGHNDYTNSEKLEARISHYGFERNISSDFTYKFLFTKQDQPNLLESGSTANKVSTGYTQSHSYFEYNDSDGLYYRFDKRFKSNDYKQTDADTGEQVTVKNIIIEYCSYSLEDDGKNKDIETVGSGKGAFCTNGKMVNITWEKEGYWDNTHYYYEDGTEIQLNPGKTWVCIVLPSMTGECEFE